MRYSGTELNVYFDAAHTQTGVRRRTGPYPWRHTYASVGLTNGPAPAFIAKQLGHSPQMFFTTHAKWISTEGDREQLNIAMGKCAQNVPAKDAESLTA